VPPVKKSVRFALIALVSMILNWILSQVLDQGWAIVLAMILAAGLGILLIKEDE
jgi:hypothetical protein